ncbi:CDP-glycerol glycerophosphotransferase family protein [Flexivirga sp. B27]
MLKREVRNLGIVVLALVATLVLLSGSRDVGVVIWAVGYLAFVWQCRKMWRGRHLGNHLIARVLLALAPAGLIIEHAVGVMWAAWTAIAVLVLMVRSESFVRRAHGYTGTRAANMEQLHLRPKKPWTVRAYGRAMLLLPLALIVLGYFHVNGLWWLLASLLVAAVACFILADAVARRAASRRAQQILPEVLTELNPAFVLYWDAPRNSQLQIGMWIPHLKRVGVPFYVMVRDRRSFAQAVSVAEDVPVLHCPSMASVERNRTDSLRAAFYVNNAARNSHFVRYSELTHIQLLHGDSDKAPSYSPVTAMFDKVFVAGQAGIDRYAAHGVYIPDEKFEIVGRPQVVGIDRRDTETLDLADSTLLYAPTWKGFHEDAAYSSIPRALDIIGEALSHGCRVIFRQHPYNDRDPEFRRIAEQARELLAADAARTGREHVFGAAAQQEMSMEECFNASDLMIADVSSVVADYLYSEKPILLANPEQDIEQFIEEFPLASATYVVDGSREQVGAALVASATDDPMGPVRRAKRAYYLGDFPDETYEEGFLTAAAAVSHAPWPPAVPVWPVPEETPVVPQEAPAETD